MPVTDHSYDPFPVTSDEWGGRNPFAEDQPSRMLSPAQEEPDTTVKSRTPSPSTELSKSPQSDTPNPSPQLNDQLSADSHLNTIISPVSKYSVSSIESGYESSMSSSSPNPVQIRNTNATSPVFYHEAMPELVPTNTNSNIYFKQKPQVNFGQLKSQQLQNPFQSTQHYQTPSVNFTASHTADLLGGYIKQEPFTLHQCAGTKCNQSMQQSTINNQPSQGFTRNTNSILGMEMLMSSFNDHIPPIAPLKELKTEDLDILEIPGIPQNVPQMPQSAPWPQNVQYVPNVQQFGVPRNNMFPGNRQVFNPLQQQQQLRNNMQSHFM